MKYRLGKHPVNVFTYAGKPIGQVNTKAWQVESVSPVSCGDFVTRLIQIDANYAFNARWSWVNLIQYDNESGSVGENSRLRWNPREGQDLYIVLNHGFDAVGFFRSPLDCFSVLS